MDSYTYRTGKLFDVVYLMGGNVRYNAMVSLDKTCSHNRLKWVPSKNKPLNFISLSITLVFDSDEISKNYLKRCENRKSRVSNDEK